MSAKEAKIENICLCLSTLTKEIAIEPPDPSEPPNNIKNSFSQDLRRNVHSTFKRLEKYQDLKDFVSEYIEPCLGDNCTSCDYLKFLQLCLILLRTLKIALEEYELSLKKSASKDPAHNQPVNKAKLSLGQVRVFIKSLQFAVALGILPNLLRGIGIPLSKRLKHAIILEHFTSESTTYQKLIQIAVCLDTLIGCLRCDAMQSLILSYNGTDILAALIQLCHAPIKKLHDTETSADIPRKGKLCFRIMLARFQDSSEHSEEQVIKMMMTLRKYFTPHLETLLKQMCPSLLMWELLLFQGIPVHPEDPDATVTKTPAWFRKLCNKMFTNLLLQENGIATLVQVVLDKSCEDYMLTSKVDAVRLEAIARLVSYNPVRHISVESYIESLSSQVFNLLHIKGSRMDGLLKYVASCIFLLFCERDIKSAEKYLLVKLLKPLWNCVRQPENIQINKVVVKETEMANCIEDLHEIFAYSKHLLSAKYSKLLFPYSQCLCNMYFFLLRGKSFLKSKVKNIIEVILRTVSDEDVLSLLHMVSFVNKKQCGVHVTKVAFKNGEEGGIVAVQSKEEDFSFEMVRYRAILDLLSELHNKNINRSYILLVLKEFCSFHLESKDSDAEENKKSGVLFNALLQELSEWNVDIGEALMSNISEVIDILLVLLESICNCQTDAVFYEKTLWVVLMILNSILESDKQLTSDDWDSLKKCLPNLEKLQRSDIDDDLKEIIHSLTVHIATHGIACKRSIQTEKAYSSFSPTNLSCDNAGLPIPSEQELTDLIAEYEEECKRPLDCIEYNSSDTSPESGESCSETSSPVRDTQNKKDMHFSKIPGDPLNSSKSVPLPAKKKETAYESAIKDIKTGLVHMQGHGLIVLKNLLEERDEETLQNREKVMNIFMKCIEYQETYVHQPSINGLAILATLDTGCVFPNVLRQYQLSEDRDTVLKLGEVLRKTTDLLGESVYKFKDALLHAFLIGTKREDPQIRSSNLSNLGQACFHLKCNIGSDWLQEILNCVVSFLKTDSDLEVRKCAVMVIELLLRGVDINIFMVLESELKNIYTQLKIVYMNETDEFILLRAQIALGIINEIMIKLFTSKDALIKEIHILQ